MDAELIKMAAVVVGFCGLALQFHRARKADLSDRMKQAGEDAVWKQRVESKLDALEEKLDSTAADLKEHETHCRDRWKAHHEKHDSIERRLK